MTVALVPGALALASPAMAAGPPTLSIRNVKVEEGDAGAAKAVFVVRLSRAANVKVHYRTNGGTATVDDFERTHGTLRFTGNVTTRRIVVKVSGDAVAEMDETFTVHLTKPRGADVNHSVGRATILDDDDAASGGASLSIGDITVTEGNTGTTDALLDVTMSASAPSIVTVDFVASNGTAGANDYDPAGGTLVFAPGDTAKQVTVRVLADTLGEPSENFRVTLSNADGATIVDAVGLGTITDDDTGGTVPPSLSIANSTVTEGNSGTLGLAFNVTLSTTSTGAVTVGYATAPGSATSPADYSATSGTLTFNPGETSKQVIVQVEGDALSEPNETFSVNLSGATNATIADNSGLGTITDNDTPSITIGSSTVAEGNAGTVTAVFNVNLSASSGNTVTVAYATADGGATEPSDYLAASAVLTFYPGEVSKQVVVQVVGDTAIETSETYSVNLSAPTNATIAGAGFGLGTITDNDTSSVTIGSSTVTEGNAGTVNAVFTVTLSAPSGNTITVSFATADGSAVAPADYVAQSGAVTFNPGETVKQVVVQVVGETVVETNEVYSVILSNPVNAAIAGSGYGVGTINNND